MDPSPSAIIPHTISTPRRSLRQKWVDRFGTLASALCALHCGVVALVPALLPMLGIGFLHDERFEWLFLAMAVAFALAAGLIGHQTHRTRSITVGFSLGILALVSARMSEVLGYGGGLVLALIGGGLLVWSHLANMRCSQGCETRAAA